MKLMTKVGAALAATVLLMFGMVSPASAATQPTGSLTSLVQTQGQVTGGLVAFAGPKPQSVCGSTNWTGKNPKTCKGTYTVYKWSASMQRMTPVFQVTNGTNIWPYVVKGYTATQKWCASNSLTCSIITSAGVTIVAGWIQAATG